MKGTGKAGKKSGARTSLESKSSNASNKASKTEADAEPIAEAAEPESTRKSGGGAQPPAVGFAGAGSAAHVGAEDDKPRGSHAVKQSVAGEDKAARESHAQGAKPSTAVEGEKSNHSVKASVAEKQASSAASVPEGGQRKSSAGGSQRKSSAGGGAPRESAQPGAETAAGGAEPPVPAVPGEEGAVPLPLPLPLPVGSAAKIHEDANANKPEEKKEPETGIPRRSTIGADSGADVGGGALQSDGGNLEKVLETYFGKQAATVQKQVQKSRRPRLIHENTYRLEPPKPFSVQPVERCIEITLNEMLGHFLYNTNEAGELAGAIAEKIRSRVMSCRFERFKIIVLVTIGQMKRQGLHIGFRNLWDPAHDAYAFGEFKNSRIYGSAQVFSIYYE